jgi:acyl-CoA dehydrogenase
MFIVPTSAPGFEIVRNIGLWGDQPGSGGRFSTRSA